MTLFCEKRNRTVVGRKRSAGSHSTGFDSVRKKHVIHWLGQYQCPSTVYTASDPRCLPSPSLPFLTVTATSHPFCLPPPLLS